MKVNLSILVSESVYKKLFSAITQNNNNFEYLIIKCLCDPNVDFEVNFDKQ